MEGNTQMYYLNGGIDYNRGLSPSRVHTPSCIAGIHKQGFRPLNMSELRKQK